MCTCFDFIFLVCKHFFNQLRKENPAWLPDHFGIACGTMQKLKINLVALRQTMILTANC